MVTTVEGAEATLVDESRAFGIDELFFSTTDKKGHIGKANHVFLRVSGFSANEVRNKPHNIIRHPEMPRVVFKILWEYIEGSKPIVAYVKNRAKDGRYYWVVALVSPTADGYLSVRFKPSSPLLSTAEGLYRHLRQIEKSIEHEGKGKQAAMAASRQELNSQLQALGFDSYDAFMDALLQAELGSREAGLRGIQISGLNLKEDGGKPSYNQVLHSVVHSCGLILKSLDPVFSDLAFYVKLNSEIGAKCAFVTSLSMSIRMLALNGAIDAKKLGRHASGIGHVLDWLQTLSKDITLQCESLSTALVQLIAEVNAITFNLGAAKLQIAMTGSFASELLVRQDSPNGVDRDSGMTDGAIEVLHNSFSETAERALAALSAAGTNLTKLRLVLEQLRTSTCSLRSVYLTGKIEMAGLESSQLESIFSELGEQLMNSRTNLSDLDERMAKLDTQIQKTVEDADGIHGLIAAIKETLMSTTGLGCAQLISNVSPREKNKQKQS